MILRIMSDIRDFIFILAVVLTGFALAFWLLSYPDYNLAFGTVEQAFLNVFLYMLGQNLSADFTDTASPELATLLLVMFMMFMMILMLNLLIALMGNSYSIVQEKGLAEWRFAQAQMILEQSYLMSQKNIKIHQTFNCIHIMKYLTLIANEDKLAEVTDGQLVTVKTSLEEKLDTISQKVDAVSSASSGAATAATGP
jgi:hypothetical protein